MLTLFLKRVVFSSCLANKRVAYRFLFVLRLSLPLVRLEHRLLLLLQHK
jgi:hypothetical protein